MTQRDAAADRLAECSEALLKFLRVSLAAGPMSANPRTEIWHLQNLKTALADYRRPAAETSAGLCWECSKPATHRESDTTASCDEHWMNRRTREIGQ
jgi:hypothetical protein